MGNLKCLIMPVSRSCYSAIHNKLLAATGNLRPNNPSVIFLQLLKRYSNTKITENNWIVNFSFPVTAKLNLHLMAGGEG